MLRCSDFKLNVAALVETGAAVLLVHHKCANRPALRLADALFRDAIEIFQGGLRSAAPVGRRNPSMTKVEALRNALYARHGDAFRVRYEGAMAREERCGVGDCHDNVARLVARDPAYKAVRGWLIYPVASRGALQFCAHSIVRDPQGRLIDITPLADERLRPMLQFLPHEGEEAAFRAIARRLPQFSVPRSRGRPPETAPRSPAPRRRA